MFSVDICSICRFPNYHQVVLRDSSYLSRIPKLFYSGNSFCMEMAKLVLVYDNICKFLFIIFIFWFFFFFFINLSLNR